MRLPQSVALRRNLRVLATVIIAAGAFVLIQRKRAPQEAASGFGQYRGYGQEAFDGTTRVSSYLPLSDGTRLAYGLILPTRGGATTDRPLPTLFRYTPYLRTFTISTRMAMTWCPI